MKPLIILVQPPFVQLNCPYPSIYYLRSFLEKRGYKVYLRDHSIQLFHKIFCKEGLEHIFFSIRNSLKSNKAAKQYKPIIERFLKEEKQWLCSIDRIVGFLQGKDREWGHFIGLAHGVLPGGPYYDSCLEEICNKKGNASVEDAPLLASKLLADIADLIKATLDPNFSLISYVPSVTSGFSDYSEVQKNLNGYIMKDFYQPLLENEWKTLAEEINCERKTSGENSTLMLGLTIPFPGCLVSAMLCAQTAKIFFNNDITTIAGGGFVNTELRYIEEESFFDFFDYLSFDRGYGSFEAIIGREIERKSADNKINYSIPLYKTIHRYEKGIVRDRAINNNRDRAVDNRTIEGKGSSESNAQGNQIDNEAVKSVFPDYSGVDFFRYICPVDDINPMHRLWSDSRWLKAYAAHGCYWHKCTFCDVSLDYIHSYQPVDIKKLFYHLVTQAEISGVRGVHLVDEACPPASLLELAQLNRDAGLPLLFWGNIRFEKSYTPDVAAILATGGVIGVCAGIEVATETGFRLTGKGIELADVVNACAAFKEAGILVHAYLIYGFWEQDFSDVINSAEILRQLFAEGLLDSAFWHKFILTVHSQLFLDIFPALSPENLDAQKKHPALSLPKKIFVLNDISYKGEDRFDCFTEPLDILLKAWMEGNTTIQIQDVFNFKVKKPSIDADLIISLLNNYIRNRS